MPQPTQNLINVLRPNTQGDGYVYTWRYPNGNRTGLPILFQEPFDATPFASMPWIVHQSGNYNYSGNIFHDGTWVIRHNLHGSRGSNDPLSSKPCSGLYTHTFLASNFYNIVDNPEISLEQRYRFDDCFWDTNVNDAYPYIAGKLFICDVTVDSSACYLSLTSNATLTFTSGNEGAPNTTWSHVDNGGWCNEDFGWRTVGNVPRNNIVFTVPQPIFQSDGVWRTLRMEVRYDPGGIGHHRARFKINGTPLLDSTGVNTDENGWYNLPPEFELKGFRVYAADLDVNDAEDVGTDPETYAGYAAGYEVDTYTLYDGVSE